MSPREQPMLGRYPLHEVLSAFRKTIKLGDVENAVYWLTVILEKGSSTAPKMAAKQLWIVAAEDVDDEAVVLRAFAVFQMAGVVPETDHLYFLVAQMCRARKWWETEEGREVDRLWSKALGDLRRDPKPVPVYALDRHTRRGWAIKRKTGHFEDRFSGTDLGRAKTAYLHQRDGRLDPDAQIDAEFWAVWRERLALEALDELPTAEDGQEPLLEEDPS